MIDGNAGEYQGDFFAVYGLDAPSFPSDEIWGHGPYLDRKLRSLYGWRPGCLQRLFRPGSCTMEELEGSLLVISGGYISLDGTGESIRSDQQKMRMSGVLGMQHGEGARFAEKALASLIEPDDRVTMLRYTFRDDVSEYLPVLQEAGFDVLESGDAAHEKTVFALCRGTGRMLAACQWLEHVWYEPFFVHANRGPHSRLESSVLEAALSQINPESAIVQLLEEVQKRPQDAERILGQDYVHICFTDPDWQSLHIIRQDPDTDAVPGILSRTAKAAGLALYDAGSLRQPDSHGHYFTEFTHWERCAPIPEHWRKVL